MSQDREEVIRELLELSLDCIEERGRAAVEQLLAAHGELAEEVRARLRILDEGGLLFGKSPPTIPRRLGEFDVLEEIGEGGMGFVYKARRVALDRLFAIKVLRPEYAALERGRRRFRREIETVAKLDHTAIVPVHEVGEDAGCLWFAMEFVDGRTLASILEHLPSRRPETLAGADFVTALRRDHDSSAPTGETLDEWRSLTWEALCLRIAVTVADALAHAHEKGIIHRDVKPSNVMVSRSGRIQLLDFGVSAVLDASDRLTRSGTRLGTLAYMPPECIAGSDETLDARMDVYALGLLLHEMLTLRPAFAGTVESIMRDVGAGRRSTVSALNPSISWEAETIVMVAADPDRERRYADAAAMRRDIEAALDHRPLFARRPALVLRLKRWSQRRPALAAATVIVLAALALVPSFVWLRERGIRRRIQEALEESEIQRSRAERGLDDVHGALRLVADLVVDGDLDLAGLEQQRRSVIETLIGYHERLVERRRDDPAMRLETAASLMAAGGLHGALGDSSAMTKRQSQAIDLLRGLVADRPTDRRCRLEFARASVTFGKNLAIGDDPIGALPKIEEGLREARNLVADIDDHDGRELLGKALYAKGLAGKAIVDPSAHSVLEEALAIVLRLEEECSEHLHSEDVALVLIERGESASSKGRIDEALADFDSAIERLERLERRHPARDRFATPLIVALVDRGLACAGAGRLAEARSSDERAITIARRLVLRAPEVPVHQIDLAAGLQNLSWVAFAQKQFDEATLLVGEARAILESMLAHDASNLAARFHLSAALARSARIRAALGDHDSAAKLLDGAAEQVDCCLAATPNDPERLQRRFAILQERLEIHRAARDHDGLETSTLAAMRVGRPGRDECLYAAAVLIEAARHARRDKSLDEMERETIAERREDAAIEILRRVEVRDGVFKKRLEEDAAFEVLRSRTDFASLIAPREAPRD